MAGFKDEDRESSTDDDWDKSSDEEEEEKKPAPVAAPAKGKKKGLAAKIAEREAKEKAARQKQQQVAELTPAERAKQIEEDELLGAAEMLAIDTKDPDSIDLNKFVPRSKHEFQVYAELLAKKFEKLNESPFYTDFACDATRSLIKGLNLEKTRKVEQVLSVQINELVKTSKGKKKGTKKKPVLGGMEKGGGGAGGRVAVDDFDDFDDLGDF